MSIFSWLSYVDLELAFIILTATIAGGLVGYSYWSDRRSWNKGIAPSGKPWIPLASDNWFDRGYKDGEGNYIFIHWRVDK